MQVDEILAISEIFVFMGVSKIRLTGGEPLVRKDAKLIMEGLSKLPVKLTITTNGVRRKNSWILSRTRGSAR